MKGEIFLTGATGYIGSSLLLKWLDSTDIKLNLLVRSKHDEGPQDRIKRVLAEISPDKDFSHFSKRIEVIGGDVSFARFGLEKSEYEMLAERVTHIIHCAAAARFDLQLDEARGINVGGAENILNFAEKCQSMRKIDYIGTAYVAGKRAGIIQEDELDKGQQHTNTYEQSKFEAEKLVRGYMNEWPITILRPSIVICDSKTGRASNYNGFYRALRMYSLGLLKVLPGRPSSLLDLVPVDYVAEATYLISINENSIGNCYHLTTGLDNMTTLEEIRDLASHHFGKEKFALIPPEEFNTYVAKTEGTLTEQERNMIEEIRLYMPYLTSELRFDNTNTVRDTNLDIPQVRSYFERMAEYMKRQQANEFRSRPLP